MYMYAAIASIIERLASLAAKLWKALAQLNEDAPEAGRSILVV